MKLKIKNDNKPETNMQWEDTTQFADKDKSQQHIAVGLAAKGKDTTVIAEIKTDANGNKTTTIEQSFKSKQYDDRLPTINCCQVPSWAMHLECPHCHDILNDWYINPEHSIQTCRSCGKKFNVARDIAMEII